MRHIIKNHEGLFERVWKSERIFRIVTRAMYRCGECKAEDFKMVNWYMQAVDEEKIMEAIRRR